MTGKLLIVRPQPGADETARRAREQGFETVVLPLFAIEPVAWEPPDPEGFDAIMLTSANAPRLGGTSLGSFTHLPTWCVGEKTAQAARAAGFTRVRTAGPDAMALLDAMGRAGVARALHLAGVDSRPLPAGAPVADSRIVYASVEQDVADERLVTAAQGAIILVHSPRAGRTLAARLPGATRATSRIVAISAAALAACGSGWAVARAVQTPDDGQMLALARNLCQELPFPQRGPSGEADDER